MTKSIWTETVGEAWMRLVESRGNYTIVFAVRSLEPNAVSIVPMGPDRERAVAAFRNKVMLHRLMASSDDLMRILTEPWR